MLKIDIDLDPINDRDNKLKTSRIIYSKKDSTIFIDDIKLNNKHIVKMFIETISKFSTKVPIDRIKLVGEYLTKRWLVINNPAYLKIDLDTAPETIKLNVYKTAIKLAKENLVKI